MSYVIETKAGMIGYYEGTMKSVLRYLETIPEEKRSFETQNAIRCLERVLSEGVEMWERAKGSER